MGAGLLPIDRFSFSKAISSFGRFFSCFLKISTRSLFDSYFKEGLNRDLVFKDRDVREIFLEVYFLVFDKTGTYTTSSYSFEKVLPLRDYSEEYILRISACLEEHIYHPS